MTTQTTESILGDIAARMQAIGEQVSEEKIRAMVQNSLDALLNDPQTPSKMRFGKAGGDRRLVGSKFARWGLSAADIELLFDIQEGLQRHNPTRYTGPSAELRAAFEAISDAVYVPQDQVREMDKRALDNVFPRIPKTAFYGKDRELAMRGAYQETEAYQRAMRAMDTAESGYGSQLVGAQYVGDLWEAARSESRVFSQLESFEMTDATAYLPVEADLPEMLFVAENTASSSSAYTTTKTGSNRVQVDAKKFVMHQMWSGEMEEDSIVAFVPYLRRQGVLALAHYSDSLVLNGDTTNAGTGNINLDDADPADTKHYLAFDGLRHAGLVDNTNNRSDMNGAITWAAMVGALGRMVDSTYLMDWGHPTVLSDVIRVCDPFTADKIGQLDEVINWKIQQGRPLLPGQVAEILGSPIISSIALRLTEADGKVSTTAGNNTKGQLLTFNKRGFVAGWRRRVKTEVERIAAQDQTRIVYSLRLGFGRYSPTGAASGIEAADVIYNITV